MRWPIAQFELGNWQFTVIQDGLMAIDAAGFFIGPSADRAGSILETFEGNPAQVPLSINILLAERDGFRMLVDTGLGKDIGNGEGRLLETLEWLGTPAERIDLVLITHGHWDHIGGLADKGGTPCFPNARHLMPEWEWRFWTAEESLQTVDETYREWALSNLPPLKDRMETFQPEEEILPGVRALDAAGHTPGQIAVLFQSEDAADLLHLADAAHHPLQCLYPDLSSAFDMDGDVSRRTRKNLVAGARQANRHLVGYHFPFPGVGSLQKKEDQVWMPAPVHDLR